MGNPKKTPRKRGTGRVAEGARSPGCPPHPINALRAKAGVKPIYKKK